jgi:hypothetical protein
MYNFTRSTWTHDATDRKRERLVRISDDDLMSTLEAAHYLCSPESYWGMGPRECYVIQRGADAAGDLPARGRYGLAVTFIEAM